MTSSGKAAALGLAAALSLSTLAACSTDDEGSSDGTVTIEVAMDVGLDADAIAAFDARIEQFEKANPDIDVEHDEYDWDATTFAAELAGGTLPDVFAIPFTDGQDAHRQRADRGHRRALVADAALRGQVQPERAPRPARTRTATSTAVPIAAYGIGLHYNRAAVHAGRSRPGRPARPRGTRCARTRRRSRTPPARPATRR